MFVSVLCLHVTFLLLFLYICSYTEILQNDSQRIVVVIVMFYCRHNNSFSGHYDDAILVDVNNARVTLNKIVG